MPSSDPVTVAVHSGVDTEEEEHLKAAAVPHTRVMEKGFARRYIESVNIMFTLAHTQELDT